jgi:hypothetical protein
MTVPNPHYLPSPELLKDIPSVIAHLKQIILFVNTEYENAWAHGEVLGSIEEAITFLEEYNKDEVSWGDR